MSGHAAICFAKATHMPVGYCDSGAVWVSTRPSFQEVAHERCGTPEKSHGASSSLAPQWTPNAACMPGTFVRKPVYFRRFPPWAQLWHVIHIMPFMPASFLYAGSSHM